MAEAEIKVSVICAWYNRPAFITDTIDSLLAQDHDDFEVIIVNDGSTNPAVRETLENYDDPRLRIFHRDNTGFVKTMRFAIEQSRGKFIAVQGAGDVSYPERLRVQSALLEERPELAGTGCGIRNLWVGGDNDGKFNDLNRSETVFFNDRGLGFASSGVNIEALLIHIKELLT